jgi:hypothetical protein
MEIPVYVNTNGAGAVYLFPNNLINHLEGSFLKKGVQSNTYFGG